MRFARAWLFCRLMCRSDPVGFAGGGIDSKCSSLAASRGGAADPLVTFARAGMTHDSLAPFCWSAVGRTAMAATPHRGHPDCFAYAWDAIAPAPDAAQ